MNGSIQREIQMPSAYFWKLVEKFENHTKRLELQIEQLQAQIDPNRRNGAGDGMCTCL